MNHRFGFTINGTSNEALAGRDGANLVLLYLPGDRLQSPSKTLTPILTSFAENVLQNYSITRVARILYVAAKRKCQH